MSRFLVGDELGNIKALRYSQITTQESEIDLTSIYHHDLASAVQKLAVSSPEDHSEQTIVFSTLSDGSCSISDLNDDSNFSTLSRWKETRIVGSKFVGISLTKDAAFSCTSSGMLRRTAFSPESNRKDTQPSDHNCATLPSRLYDWRLSENVDTFSYGGDEVDLSVWNTELAFQKQPEPGLTSSKKRKRNDELFPAEVWRARNVPNDHLGLRQPVRITTLAYLQSAPQGQHLITGTQFGDLRRYDTRAARRPVSNWTGLGKVGGVKVVEKGYSEHELFMGDAGSNLYSIDLRTGGVLYGYRGLSGAVTSIAPSPTLMVSTALDRLARVHSLVAPPGIAGSHQERKGEVLEKTYLAGTPTVVIWDRRVAIKSSKKGSDAGEGDDDDVWDNLENVS